MIKSKLKRRLRKKKRLGEFQELGFEIFTKLGRDFDEVEFDRFLDDFIDEIEKRELRFGGSGTAFSYQGFVASAKKFASPSSDDKEQIRIWLEDRPEVESCRVGEFLDAWNDPKWND